MVPPPGHSNALHLEYNKQTQRRQTKHTNKQANKHTKQVRRQAVQSDWFSISSANPQYRTGIPLRRFPGRQRVISVGRDYAILEFGGGQTLIPNPMQAPPMWTNNLLTLSVLIESMRSCFVLGFDTLLWTTVNPCGNQVRNRNPFGKRAFCDADLTLSRGGI